MKVRDYAYLRSRGSFVKHMFQKHLLFPSVVSRRLWNINRHKSLKKRLEEIIDFTGDENDYVVVSDLECLKYLHENGCPWNEEVCCYAARGGHFEILNYLHAKGCPTSEADDEDDQDLEHSIKRQRMIDELGIPNQNRHYF